MAGSARGRIYFWIVPILRKSGSPRYSFWGFFWLAGAPRSLGLLAIIEKLRPEHLKELNPLPPVTVLIPAHNEEGVILQTVTSVLAADYPEMHVIVVNDGSTDDTGELLDAHFSDDPRVRIIHQSEPRKSGRAEPCISEAETEISSRLTPIPKLSRTRFASWRGISPTRIGRNRGQRESRQPFALADALAGAGIHHQPEHGKARVRFG